MGDFRNFLVLILVILAFFTSSCSENEKNISPLILDVIPREVWRGEDNQIQIRGKNFIPRSEVNLKNDSYRENTPTIYVELRYADEVSRLNLDVLQANMEEIQFILPKGLPPGEHKIYVELANGNKDSSIIKVLKLRPPELKSVKPAEISNLSETKVKIDGKYLQEITAVYVGETKVDFSYSETGIVIIIPEDFSSGTYKVKVVNSEGKSAEVGDLRVFKGAEVSLTAEPKTYENTLSEVSLLIENTGELSAEVTALVRVEDGTFKTKVELSQREKKEVKIILGEGINLSGRSKLVYVEVFVNDSLGGKDTKVLQINVEPSCFVEICDGVDNDCDGFIDEGVIQVFYKDVDGDGYSDGTTSFGCQPPEGYATRNNIVELSGDCDDSDPEINPGASELCDNQDNDCDGTTDEDFPVGQPCDGPDSDLCLEGTWQCSTTGTVLCSDTTDDNTEICDGVDNNCDGEVDEGLVQYVYYQDQDGDGYGSSATYQTCLTTPPQGYASQSGDCDDTNSGINPGETEVCDGMDNDCDGQTDEGVLSTFYQDQDGDGYGNPSSYVSACSPPQGFVSNSSDCDDSDPEINPSAEELCDNLDNNCDGNVDEGLTQYTYYQDQDGDGYGSSSTTFQTCLTTPPQGYASQSGDCDDSDPTVYSGAGLVCGDSKDNDCDGNIEVWVYQDQDGDRYAPSSVSSCTNTVSFPGEITAGYELGLSDCDDADPDIYPGNTPVCGDGKDNDCIGAGDEIYAYEDKDGDLYAPNSVSFCTNSVNFPGEITVGSELGVNDCDDANSELNPDTIWYLDSDGDGYYPSGGSSVSCADPYTENSTYTTIPGGDCDDGDASVYPGAPLVCGDGKDSDCDGNVEGVFWEDQDGDGWTTSVSQCANTMPTGFTSVSNPSDCDDTDPGVYPGATLVCGDSKDSDCDGSIESIFWEDQDGDGYTTGVSTCANTMPSGFTSVYNPQDCDDTNSTVYPGATTTYGNGSTDDNCDGLCDVIALRDGDGDRYAPSSTEYCLDSSPYPGYITKGYELGLSDCDDADPDIYPGNTPVCGDGKDNDCDGNVEKWVYTDADGDKYSPSSISSCVNVVSPGQITAGFQKDVTDCNDYDPSVWYWSYVDEDGDLHAPSSLSDCIPITFPGRITVQDALGTLDCDDSDPLRNPSASEVCNGADDDCDTQIDEGLSACYVPPCPTSIDATSYFSTQTGAININVVWNDISSNEDGFVLEKSKSSDFSQSISFVLPPNTVSFTLDFEEPLTQFWFRVYAFNSTGGVCKVQTKTSEFTPPGLLWMYQVTGNIRDNFGYPTHPKVYDINGDGKSEVLVGDDSGYLYAISTYSYNLDISAISLWVKQFGGTQFSTSAIMKYGGKVTIVVPDYSNDRFLFLDGSGNFIFDVLSSGIPFPPIVTDLNSDSSAELILPAENEIIGYDLASGVLFSVSPPPGEIFRWTALARYGGSTTAFFVGTNKGTLKFINGGVDELLSLKLQGAPEIFFLSSGDFDSDGFSEVVLFTSEPRVRVIRGVKNPIVSYQSGGQVHVKPLFYDFNGDGRKDVVFGAIDGKIYFVDGKTEELICSLNTGGPIYSSPATVIRSGSNSILIVFGNDNGRFFALKPDCSVEWQLSFPGARIRSSPIVSDLDNDSELEIIFNLDGVGDEIVVLDEAGNVEASINVGVIEMRSDPVIYDIDGDGNYEVIMGGDSGGGGGLGGGIYVVSSCGVDCFQNELTITQSGWGDVRVKPLIYDVNSDGTPDIIFPDSSERMRAVSGTAVVDGAYNSSYDIWVSDVTDSGVTGGGAIFPSSPTVFLKNGVPLIAIGSAGSGIYIIRASDGSIVANPDPCNGDNIFSSPATVDFNSDRTPDIVVGCSDGGVYVISGDDFSTLRFDMTGGEVLSSPRVEDFDGDGVLDWGVGSNDRSVYVFNGRVIEICSFQPANNQETHIAVYNGGSNAIFSDGLQTYLIKLTDCSLQTSGGKDLSLGSSFAVFRSGSTQLFAGGIASSGEIDVFREDFSSFSPFPFTDTTASWFSAPVLQDMDSDGSIEMVITSDRKVFAYRLTTVWSNPEWGESFHDRHNSSMYAYKGTETNFMSPQVLTGEKGSEEGTIIKERRRMKKVSFMSSHRQDVFSCSSSHSSYILIFAVVIILYALLCSSLLSRRGNTHVKKR